MKTYTVQKQVSKYELWNAKIEANSPEDAKRLVLEGKGDWRYTCNLDEDEEILNVDILELNEKDNRFINEIYKKRY